jgi:hypothetical protein
VPFLTDRFLTDPEQVELLYRPLCRLRSLPPERPSEPVIDDVAPQKGVEDAADVGRGVTMQLDIAVWRSRWLWRLAVKAAVRFFRS